jgi:glycosyltransferase involved in cell wall biosynthesis
MIVRDAERSLAAALQSARPFVDEMIVVDTGSTDRSRELAVQSGAQVFDFPWCDDFSAARNESLEKASADWVFWMDADDVLPAESGRELRRLVAAHPNRDVAFWGTVEERAAPREGGSRIMGHGHVKLFPRHPEVRFRYRVHEQISPAIKRLKWRLLPTSLIVEHSHADRSAEAEAARCRRNLRLLLLDLADFPEDPFLLLNIGATYLFMEGSLDLSIAFLRRSIDLFESGVPTQLNAYLYLGQAYGAGGNRAAECRTYEAALTRFPNDAVVLLRLAAAHEKSGNLTRAAMCYQTALAKGKVRPSIVHVRHGPAHAVFRLGRIYTRQGQPAKAIELWERFLQNSPEESRIARALADLRGNTEE